MNGKAWTREEIARTAEVFAAGGSLAALAAEIGRTEPAVMAKISRITIRPPVVRTRW